MLQIFLGISLFVSLLFVQTSVTAFAQISGKSNIQCKTKQAPKINVIPSNSHVRYDFSKTKAQLNTVDVDTVSPYGPNHKTYVSGLMSGSIEMKSQVAFAQETYPRRQQGCLYVQSVDVKIHIDPTIFVASEYPKGSCMHNAVLTHEYKHVREDQLIVNKYSNIIGRVLADVVNSRGAAFGPYETARIPHVQQNVQNSFAEVIKKYNQKMNEERQRRQQGIDSLEEYQSIGKRCKPQRRG